MRELLDLLGTFISFRSVAPDAVTKSACLDWVLREFLSPSGIAPERGEVGGAPYIFLRHPQPKLFWFGHTDVVPGRDDQFTLRIEGDRALGRGVKDMKGADIAFLIAYRDACAAGRIPPVSVLLTSDEEIGGFTPPALLDKKILGDIPVAFTPDTGETDGIVTELKGGIWIRLIADGKSGHAAAPWKSDNPVPRLFRAVEQMRSHFPDGTGSDWQVTMTPTQTGASDATNRIPDSAWCLLDVRFPPLVWKTPDIAWKNLQALVPEGCRLERVRSAEPTYCDPAHPMVLQLQEISAAVLNAPVKILREHGASDARHFTARGIPAFLNGPVGGDLHGSQEWVSIPSLLQHLEINRRWLALL